MHEGLYQFYYFSTLRHTIQHRFYWFAYVAPTLDLCYVHDVVKCLCSYYITKVQFAFLLQLFVFNIRLRNRVITASNNLTKTQMNAICMMISNTMNLDDMQQVQQDPWQRRCEQCSGKLNQALCRWPAELKPDLHIILRHIETERQQFRNAKLLNQATKN